MDLKLTPSSSLIFFSFFFIFSCRMERGHKEVSTNQARRRRGTPWKTPIASSLVAAMFVEKLRLYSQILVEISLKSSNDVATITIGEVDNIVYFTRE